MVCYRDGFDLQEAKRLSPIRLVGLRVVRAIDQHEIAWPPLSYQAVPVTWSGEPQVPVFTRIEAPERLQPDTLGCERPL